MKRSLHVATAFSLVEVTLALGVAAFAFTAILGMLPVASKTQQASVNQTEANDISSQIAADFGAATRLPPGQQSKQFSLKGHWAAVNTPDTLYFTINATQTGSVNAGAAPADAVFKATVTYIFPPTDTTSLADIVVSWPAAQSDLTKVTGSVETFIAINR
jgi:uncharacterized protein (TIGR02598 family)